MNTRPRPLTDCMHASCSCEPFAISGASGAVAAAVVRLLDHGWRLCSEPQESSAGLWRMRVQRA